MAQLASTGDANFDYPAKGLSNFYAIEFYFFLIYIQSLSVYIQILASYMMFRPICPSRQVEGMLTCFGCYLPQRRKFLYFYFYVICSFWNQPLKILLT